MICFQNLYLWLSDTTLEMQFTSACLLWFAFKIYIFDFLIQPQIVVPGYIDGCDLLSKFISLTFWYNPSTLDMSASVVVICFQNLYLWLSDTTRNLELHWKDLLWFAFKIYIFDFLIQHKQNDKLNDKRCDLLSKFISLTFWYNATLHDIDEVPVVICFQNLYLWLSDTTCLE